MSLPDFASIDACLAHYAVHAPDKVAFSSEDLTVTYAELPAIVERYASALQAAGIRPGDFVGTLGHPRVECYLVFLACSRIGAVFAGLNPKHTLPELTHVVNDCRPRLIFNLHGADEPEQQEKLDALRTDVAGLEGIVARCVQPGSETRTLSEFLAAGEAPVSGTKPDGEIPAAIVYTSGSTGEPKGALLSERGMLRNAALTWRYWYGGVKDVRATTHHPINHVGWLVVKGLCTVVAGGTLFIRERFDPAAVARLIEQEQLTLWNVFPAELAMVSKTPEFAAADLSSLECVAFGTMPSRESLRALRARSEARFSVSYGLTECSGGAVTATGDDATIEEVATSVGRPVPGIETRVIDPVGADVPDGTAGELLVRDASVFLGYLNRPKETAEVIDAAGWLHTGDAVTVAPDGTLRLTGRLKEMYKSGGYNVYPTEVETALSSHPRINAVAVVPAPDPVWSEVGVAFVVPEAGAELDSAELKGYCRERLANYKIPKRFVVVDELPQLRNGKVDRIRLRHDACDVVVEVS
jgi:acyl-CoA synthetase (AMP-forming)/AMP-acid ligase II